MVVSIFNEEHNKLDNSCTVRTELYSLRNVSWSCRGRPVRLSIVQKERRRGWISTRVPRWKLCSTKKSTILKKIRKWVSKVESKRRKYSRGKVGETISYRREVYWIHERSPWWIIELCHGCCEGGGRRGWRSCSLWCGNPLLFCGGGINNFSTINWTSTIPREQ